MDTRKLLISTLAEQHDGDDRCRCLRHVIDELLGNDIDSAGSALVAHFETHQHDSRTVLPDIARVQVHSPRSAAPHPPNHQRRVIEETRWTHA